MNSFIKEPARLSKERQRLETELVSIGVKHYDVFIECAKESFKAKAEMQKCKSTTATLCRNIEDTQDKCHKFIQFGSKWSQERHQSKALIDNYMKLSELLDVPLLIEQCARSGMYAEISSLYNRILPVISQHSNIPMMVMLKKEIEDSIRKVYDKVLATLGDHRTTLTIPICISMVNNFLKQLKFFSSARELRQVFVARRFKCLEEHLNEAINTSVGVVSPVNLLNRLSNILRSSLVDIVSQYRALFDPKSIESNAGLDVNENQAFDVLPANVYAVISFYIEHLKKNIKFLNSGSELRTVMDTTRYMGVQFENFGMDIRGLLAPIFVDRVRELYIEGLRRAGDAFRTSLPSIGRPLASANIIAEPSEGNPLAPPREVISILPLAKATIEYLNTLNEIRMCAPKCLTYECKALTEGLLTEMSTELDKVYEEYSGDTFEKAGRTFHDCLVPYFARCFFELFHTELTPPARKHFQPLQSD